MSQIVIYVAVSADGFIATPDGGVAWLEAFPAQDVGYDEFFATVGTVVLGRATYEQVLGFGPWPYAEKRGVVLSSRPLEGLPAGVEVHAGDVRELATELRRDPRDTWLVGGAQVFSAFLDAHAVDRLELYVAPVLLGGGIPLFAPSARVRSLTLVGTERFENGLVRLAYEVD